MSLFFSRYLGGVAAIAAALWLVAAVAGFFGFTNGLGGWTQERYFLASAIIALAVLATTAVLIGVNLRATGQFDGSTVAIAALGVAATVTSGLLAWVVGIWVPLLAAAVTWTMIRAYRTHAGSQTFAIALAVAMPLCAALALISTVITFTVPFASTEMLGWVLFAGMALFLAAGLADVAVRLVRRVTHSKAAIA